MKNYTLGQKVQLDNGKTGEVISIATKGNGDIRPPYNREGIPTIKGIDFIGYLTIIPNDWKKLYSDEIYEKELINL
jgi:hypothetical protein